MDAKLLESFLLEPDDDIKHIVKSFSPLWKLFDDNDQKIDNQIFSTFFKISGLIDETKDKNVKPNDAVDIFQGNGNRVDNLENPNTAEQSTSMKRSNAESENISSKMVSRKRARQTETPTHFEILRARRNDSLYDRVSDEAFFSELRVTRSTFNHLLKYLTQNELFQKEYWGGNFALKLETVLQIFLNYTGERRTFKELSKKFRISESAIMTNFGRCVQALNELEDIEMAWPSTEEEFQVIQDGFEEKYKLKNVIGSIGACCIQMRTSKEPPPCYKIGSLRSLMYLLAVCDSDLKFSYVNIGFPATCTVEEAFQSSQLGNLMEDFNETVHHCEGNYVIGSTDFSLRQHLLIPYDSVSTEKQADFNARLHQAYCINDAFSLLRSRFRVLQTQIYSSLDKIPNIVKACCVVHNIALQDPSDKKFIFNEWTNEDVDYKKFIEPSDFIPPCETDKACFRRDKLAMEL